jgi:hypothetical protein
MKKQGMTIMFVLVCIGVLVAAYGVGVGVRELRFYYARTGAGPAAKADVTDAGAQSEGTTQKPEPAVAEHGPQNGPGLEDGEPGNGSPREAMRGFRRAPGMPTREELANMSDEERREAFARMRERMGGFGGRQRPGGPQLSDEDREKMRQEYEKLRENWPQMSDEEKQKAEAEFREKYGYFRSPDARGGRGFGGAGGRRRSRPDDGQQ